VTTKKVGYRIALSIWDMRQVRLRNAGEQQGIDVEPSSGTGPAIGHLAGVILRVTL
jgi:hypothetical protein